VTLTEFLTARIDEDEAAAKGVLNAPGYFQPVVWAYFDVDFGGLLESRYNESGLGQPSRVLAECAAKRGAIEAAWADHCQIESEWGTGKGRAQMEAAGDYPEVVQHLALPYADHPDYQQEWKP